MEDSIPAIDVAITLIPANMTAKCGVPKTAGGKLSLDGKSVKGVEANGALFIDNVGSGKHEILLQK